MEEGFQKADSHNLPNVDVIMISDFLASNPDINQPQSSGVKLGRSARKSYGDSAVGYVQVRREGNKCLIKGRICPEHRVRMKPYSVQAIINEEIELVEEVRCIDCAAAERGCKHAMAFLMWLHRRAEEPAPTTVVCYWKKPILSQIGSTVKFIKSKDIGKTSREAVVTKSLNTEGFLDEVLEMAASAHNSYLCPLLLNNNIVSDSRKLSLHYLVQNFIDQSSDQTAIGFIKFCKNSINKEDIEIASKLSRAQSEDSLWFELRYGRITASKLYEAAVCKTANGSLVSQIMGVAKKFDTPAMKRGRDLEKLVMIELQNKLNITVNHVGFTILKENGVLGASPDGVTGDAVIEIKCPVSEKSFRRYISSTNEIAKKDKAQINLQMLALNLKKGIFCVANPNFEETKEITIVNLEYDAEFTEHLMECALDFWKSNIFKLLYQVFDK